MCQGKLREPNFLTKITTNSAAGTTDKPMPSSRTFAPPDRHAMKTTATPRTTTAGIALGLGNVAIDPLRIAPYRHELDRLLDHRYTKLSVRQRNAAHHTPASS